MSDSFSNRLILVADDEPRMVKFIRTNLEMDGFRVISASNGLEAADKVRKELPDLVLLDVMMPQMDGFEALERIRQVSDVPVIMLTVKAEQEDKHIAFSRGADDYVTKPFSPRELTDRIRAVLRRSGEKVLPADSFVEVDDRLQIDFANHEVIADGERVKLRPTEWRLLYHLVQNPGWIMTYDTLLQKVWGYEYQDDIQLLRMYVTYLRQKIEKEPSKPHYIQTERGFGYRFTDYRRDDQEAEESE